MFDDDDDGDKEVTSTGLGLRFAWKIALRET